MKTKRAIHVYDTVQPTKLCMEVIHKFKPWHRAMVLAFPQDGKCTKCIKVKWTHDRKPTMMAVRYVELVEHNNDTPAPY